MSGGSLDYFYSSLEEHVGDFGDRELDDLVKDLSKLFHDREWFLSSDTCEGNWNEARDNFKKKWFSGNSRQDRIDKYLSEVREELLKSFGLSGRYCKNCKNWTVEEGEYGNCAYEKHCLMHRSESCDRFEARQSTVDSKQGEE